jgi:hypothetical protein
MSEISNVIDVKTLEDVKKGHNVISFPNIKPPVPLLDIDPKGEAQKIYGNRDAGGFGLKELRQLRSLPQAAINRMRTTRKASSLLKESFSVVGATSLSTVIIVIVVLIVVCYVYRDLIKRLLKEVLNPVTDVVTDITGVKAKIPGLTGGARRYVPPPVTRRYVPPPTTRRYVPPPVTRKYVSPPAPKRYTPSTFTGGSARREALF